MQKKQNKGTQAVDSTSRITHRLQQCNLTDPSRKETHYTNSKEVEDKKMNFNLG